MTERQTRANSLPSCLHFYPSFVLSLSIYLVCSSVTFTLCSLSSDLYGPMGLSSNVCRRPGNVSGFERRQCCNQSKWNLVTQQEHKGDRLSAHHVKNRKHRGRRCFVFLWLFRFRQLTLPPLQSAGAGGWPQKHG